MAYKKINLIIRNLYEFIKEKIEVEGYAIREEGEKEEGTMGLFDAFPVEEFRLPAVSIDFVTSLPMRETGLGGLVEKRHPVVIDIFARDKFERDSLISVLTEALEKNAIPLMDYSQATPTRIKTMKFKDVEGSTIRIVSIGQEEENRGKISFAVAIEEEI